MKIIFLFVCAFLCFPFLSEGQEKKVKALEKQLSAKEQLIESYRQQIKDLNKELSTSSKTKSPDVPVNDNSALLDQIQQLEQSNNSLKSDLNQVNRLYRNLKSDSASFKNPNKQLPNNNKEFNAMRKQLNELQIVLQETSDKNNRLNARVQAQDRQIAENKRIISALRQKGNNQSDQEQLNQKQAEIDKILASTDFEAGRKQAITLMDDLQQMKKSKTIVYDELIGQLNNYVGVRSLLQQGESILNTPFNKAAINTFNQALEQMSANNQGSSNPKLVRYETLIANYCSVNNDVAKNIKKAQIMGSSLPQAKKFLATAQTKAESYPYLLQEVTRMIRALDNIKHMDEMKKSPIQASSCN